MVESRVSVVESRLDGLEGAVTGFGADLKELQVRIVELFDRHARLVAEQGAGVEARVRDAMRVELDLVLSNLRASDNRIDGDLGKLLYSVTRGEADIGELKVRVDGVEHTVQVLESNFSRFEGRRNGWGSAAEWGYRVLGMVVSSGVVGGVVAFIIGLSR